MYSDTKCQLAYYGHLENFLNATKSSWEYIHARISVHCIPLAWYRNRTELSELVCILINICYLVHYLCWKFLNVAISVHRNAIKYGVSQIIFWSENSFVHFNSDFVLLLSWVCIWVLYRNFVILFYYVFNILSFFLFFFGSCVSGFSS